MASIHHDPYCKQFEFLLQIVKLALAYTLITCNYHENI